MQNRAAEISMPVPLKVVGSSVFGRFPKISAEKTFNMFTVDGFSVNLSGYQFQIPLSENGRGLYSSNKANQMFAVALDNAYRIQTDLQKALIFSLDTNSGNVFIDEDILGNIGFVDGTNIYIYNYVYDINYITGQGYQAGTISQSGTTITGVGTAFNANMEGGTIYFSDNTSATITHYSSATSLEVNTSTSISSTADYLIIYQLDCVPNYICFHNGRFIVTSASSGGVAVGQWCLSKTYAVGHRVYVAFPNDAQHRGGFQTKPDLPIAVVRFPGRENNILILGSISGELWSDAGLALFPYVRNTSFNLDFGCVNPATISTLNNLVVWVGQNERSGPVIMYTTGQDVKEISTDGINDLFEQLENPELSYGFTFKQTGHLFYVSTFYGTGDNVTLAYDFSNGSFYNLTDENLDYYIAKHTVYFNNTYYFISINDGGLYELDTTYDTYQYENAEYMIPRSRVTDTWRSPDNATKRGNALWFVVEQGVDANYTGQGNNIASIAVTDSGADYTECQVIIEGDGAGAYATATIVDGEIDSVSVVNPGIGYTWAVVTLTGDGTGAYAEPTLNVISDIPRVDLSISYDGGYTWSTPVEMQMQTVGHYKNRFYHNGLGSSNEFTYQLNYRIKGRFVCTDGQVSYY